MVIPQTEVRPRIITLNLLRSRTTPTFVAAFILFFALLFAPALAGGSSSVPQHAAEEKSADPAPAIVIGFVGGFVNQDNPVHAEVQLAVRLRKAYPSGVFVAVYEDRHVVQAHKKILALLSSGDVAPGAEQKSNARIALYGHSWGGAAAVILAQDLQKDGVPVLITIQVDSIAKCCHTDTIIPANVAQAANFYQTHGILHGDHDIRAADPSHTHIIGNFRFDYASSPLKCSRYPWWDRYVVKAHTQIECDPVVWNRVEDLIRAALRLPARSAAN